MIAPHQLHLHALVSGLPAPRRSVRVLFMYQAMIDETDSHELGPTVFLLGGYIASVEQWEGLTDAWKNELDRDPKLQYFSFREAYPTSEKPHGQFANFSEAKRDERVANFRRIIERYITNEIIIGFLMQSYNDTFRGRRKMINNPNHFALPNLMAAAAQNLKEAGMLKQPVEFICDDRKIEERNLLDAWFYARKHSKPEPPDLFDKILTTAPVFRSSRDVIALQTADLFVGWTRRVNIAVLNGKEPPRLPGATLDLCRTHISFTADK